MKARLVECSDYYTQYGILPVKGVSSKEVQKKIYEIKNRFQSEGFDDWCIDDVFAEFPEEWEWELTQGYDVIEI